MTKPESLSLSLNSVTESSADRSLSRWHLKEYKMRWKQHAATNREPRGGDALRLRSQAHACERSVTDR